ASGSGPSCSSSAAGRSCRRTIPTWRRRSRMPTESDRHERTDVSVRGVLLAALSLAAAGIAVQLVVGVQFAALRGARARENPPAPVAAAPPEGPPEPRLQTMPAEDLVQLRA